VLGEFGKKEVIEDEFRNSKNFFICVISSTPAIGTKICFIILTGTKCIYLIYGVFLSWRLRKVKIKVKGSIEVILYIPSRDIMKVQ